MYGVGEREPETHEPTHADLVAAVARFLKPKHYVELGVDTGTSFNRIAPYCERSTGVDHRACGAHVDQNEARIFVQSDSCEFLKAQEDNSIDLCFVDSSHAYEATLHEFELLDRKVRPNGIVCFHDSYPPDSFHQAPGLCGAVFAAIAKLKTDYASRWEFCTLPAQFGVTIARKNLGKQVMYD